MKRRGTNRPNPTPRQAKRQRGAKGNHKAEGQESSDDECRPKHILLEDEKNEEEFIEEGGKYVEDIYIPPKLTQVAHAGVGERLVIEKIVCENFKSYAGVKEMGPFHKNFTSIVGPNGNGKSNIIDAMLFVFGYKSAKIRCKKVPALIHKSDLLPNVSSCSVTVYFGKIYDSGNSDDEDSLNILPNTRINVTRKATASGSSEYLLEGKKVKFQDVATFLKKNGIDIIHNRFLILQGEVESIAQMPPKAPNTGLEFGLMEYLEDIIGTRRYLKCLIKLEARIKQLDFEREAKLHQVDLVEQEKKAMKEPVRKAKEYLEDMNSKIRVEHQLLQLTVHNTSKDFQDIEEKKTEANNSLKIILDRLGEIKATSDEKTKELQAIEKKYRDLEADYKKHKLNMNNLDSEFTKINEQLQRANTQRKKANSDIKKLELDLNKLDELPAQHDEHMSALQKRFDELVELCQSEERKVEQLCSKLQVKIEAILKEKDESDRNLMELKRSVNEKKSKVAAANSDLSVYKQLEEVERAKYETYQKELEQTKENLKAKGREIRSSSGKTENFEELEKILGQKDGEYRELVALEKAKSDELSKIQNAYQENKEVFDGSATNDVVYRAFLKEKNEGRLLGVHGRLKDLATIEEKYNVAASVSSGRWEFWVCDTDDTAEQCIQTLKRCSLPPQNFICLNKLKKYEQSMKAPFKCPSRSQRIFDLLKFTSPEVSPAFYQTVSNTLVAENLQIASEIAYGPTRFRVATLNGDLIDSQGSMSGGGSKKPPGRLNSGMAERLANSVSSEQLKQQQVVLKQCQKEHEQLFGKVKALDQEIRQLSFDLNNKRMKMATFENDIKSLKSQIALKEKRLQEQELKLKSSITDPEILQGKEKVLKNAEKELEKVSGPCDEAEAENLKIKERLNSFQVTEKNEIKKKLTTLLDQKKKVANEMNKQTVSMKNYEKNRAKIVSTIERQKTERENLQTEMKELSSTKEEHVAKAKELNAMLLKVQTEKEEAKREFDEQKDQTNSFRDEENNLNKQRVEIETKLVNVMNKFKNLQHTIEKSKKELEELKLKEIPDETVEPLQVFSAEELDTFRKKDLELKLEKRQQKLEGKHPNLKILDEYRQKIDQFLREVEGLDKVTSRRDEIRDAYIKAEAQRLSEFMEGYAIISSKLKEMFRMISMGGDAELDLLNKTDPFLEGVELCVRPANKAWKPIKHLSGGEKTLSSLALVFALHHFKPSPFYIMDEIDAALDFKNVSIIANYIKDRTKFTQFIIISLRSNMFELADSLLGVYKVDNMSHCVHMAIGHLIKKLKKICDEKGKPFPFKAELARLKGVNHVGAPAGDNRGNEVDEIFNQPVDEEDQESSHDDVNDLDFSQ